MDYKIVLATAATIISFIGYLPYIRDVLKGTTKPHLFTWLIWTLLTGIAFLAQVAGGGGTGAYVTAFSTIMCLIIAVLAFPRGEKNITRLDWACFIAALFGIVLWQLTGDPLLAVIIVVATDTVAFVPTFRKAFWKPREETAIMYALDTIRFILAIIALESFSVTTWLYPAAVAFTDGIFVIFVLIRRRQIGSAT